MFANYSDFITAFRLVNALLKEQYVEKMGEYLYNTNKKA